MFKNAIILKLAAPVSFDALTAGAERAQFAPCGPTQPMSAGFVPPREKSGAPVEAIGGHWIMKCLIETKPVPGSEINKRAQAMADRLEQETGRKPGRKQMRELKEQALQELLPAAFPKQTAVLVWIDPERQFVVMDTASVGKSDQVGMLMAKAVQGFGMKPLVTEANPESLAAHWLGNGETGVADFSLGRDAELRSSDGSKAAVKYKAHSLDTDEIKKHARRGYAVKRLGLDWKGRTSFVLDPQDMVLRRIQFDDVVFEAHRDADDFDADVAILTGELGPLLDDLVAVLGGLKGGAA